MKRVAVLLGAGLVLLAATTAPAAETLHLLIMSPADPKREAPKYEALSAYLRASNPLLGDIKLRIARDYPEAVRLFKEGDAEGMFSGSFVAAVFIAKGVAKPVARPLGANGVSTYRAAVVAKAGTRPFGGIADLRGRRVAYSLLASAGEIFVRTLLRAGEKPESVFTPVPVPTHQAALDAVAAGTADYAVVKDTVFSPAEYPGLAIVGTDVEENPDSTLIMPDAAHAKYGAMMSRALLALEADTGEKAQAVKDAFGCKGFIATQVGDFVHTFKNLEKAHVDPKTFDFSF
jgi:ABC-type phosphate/phosphonate transport system substrate-binding protein